jgi:hypothetical protein
MSVDGDIPVVEWGRCKLFDLEEKAWECALRYSLDIEGEPGTCLAAVHEWVSRDIIFVAGDRRLHPFNLKERKELAHAVRKRCAFCLAGV